jgi:SAM-dependent methyltransferase
LALLRGFRHEADNPHDFYCFLAEDTVAQVQRYTLVDGAIAVDVGGGPGYVADAFKNAGAECFVVDPAPSELTLHGRQARRAFIADGCLLPIRDRSVDISVSSNVIEHVRDPKQFLTELVRVVKPAGLTWLSFTNWYSPWGGHETSPWHYLGGSRAVRHYERREGRQPKNCYGESLFPLHIHTVLSWARTWPEVQLVDAYPRYYPSWTRPLVEIPGLREVATWNLAIVLRRQV